MSDSNSTHIQKICLALGLALALSAPISGCKEEGGSEKANNEEDTGGSATETNVQPAPCSDDDGCPEGIKCVTLEGAEIGFCDVNEMAVDAGGDASADASMGVSSAAPAPCHADTDCPEGIACVLLNDAGPGFCDVEEMGVSPSLAAPAPCMSNDECPKGIDCIFPNGEGGPGICDVNEMIAP